MCKVLPKLFIDPVFGVDELDRGLTEDKPLKTLKYAQSLSKGNSRMYVILPYFESEVQHEGVW